MDHDLSHLAHVLIDVRFQICVLFARNLYFARHLELQVIHLYPSAIS